MERHAGDNHMPTISLRGEDRSNWTECAIGARHDCGEVVVTISQPDKFDGKERPFFACNRQEAATFLKDLLDATIAAHLWPEEPKARRKRAARKKTKRT